MGVPLLDSLNYNIFNVTTLPLHNLLQTPPEIPGNQWENARILSKRVENIDDIFSQSRNCCWSVCIAPVFYIAPDEIVQRTEIELYDGQLQPPFFWVENSSKWHASWSEFQPNPKSDQPCVP